MTLKKVGFFILALIAGCLMAVHRWGDSSHAIGLISINGGQVRHPALMNSGMSHYSQITTLTVLPPFKGDVEIVLEGKPELAYALYLSKPIIDLGIRRIPELKGNLLCNLEAGDRLALWTLIRPMSGDYAKQINDNSVLFRFSAFFYDLISGLNQCVNVSGAFAQNQKPDFSVHGKYTLAFYDTATGRPVLSVPLIFRNPEEKNGRKHH